MPTYRKLGPDDPLPTLAPLAVARPAGEGLHAVSGVPIYHRIEQRSAVWFYRRAGLPTASEFARILTPGGKVSTQAEDYAHRLLAELMLGRPIEDDLRTPYMDRGTDMEDAGIDAFEFHSGRTTDMGGFVTDDQARYGCSPDRLVEDDSLLEMKIPAANNHVRYLLDPQSLDGEKRCQTQGQLLVTGRKQVYLMSFHPELPPVIRRVQRDEKYLDLMRTALDTFCEQLALMRRKLEDLYGPFPQIVIPAEARGPEEISRVDHAIGVVRLADELGFDVTPADVARMVATGLSVPTEAK